MNGWIVSAIIAGAVVLGAVAIRLGWIDLRDKRRGGGGAGVFGIGDEVFAPRKYEAQVELDRQSMLPAPAPLPGDGDKGIAFIDDEDELAAPPRKRGERTAPRYRGSIRLDL
ncbi:hypothetical protein [Agromyces archimandritae]|uniref:Uncharacterized protein n=1 Tax=Agromyces archimandritae TaxID=2781962 RepID=A0A975FKJ3_9MICO|nr:hypothetical protein [Agromyces archimandritae]QTX03551.1 hypothetical protein G127AT_09305 [Agromyces archimandritae]